MATCSDCFYAYVDHGTWRCKKKFGKIDFDDSPCSNFVTEETKSCGYCTYCDRTWRFGGFKCTYKNKKMSGDEFDHPACMYFVED